MKIAIDCRCLRKPPSGVPNATLEIINNLSMYLPEAELYLLSNEEFHPEYQERIKKNINIHICIAPFLLCKKIAIIWYLFKPYFLTKKIKPEYFLATSFLLPPFLPGGIKKIVIIHDLVYKKLPETMSFTNRLIFKLFHDTSIKSADIIWTFSKYTREQLISFYPFTKDKSFFTGFGINQEIYKPLCLSEEAKIELKKKYKVQDKIILFVGTVEPRKNLKFLLSLMPNLAKKGFYLIIAGAKGWGNTEISNILGDNNFPKERVLFTGHVSNTELIKLYNIATIYVSTSFNEGFGMPQLEAMSCGCPVVSPHNSAMIEIVKDAGETVQSWNKEDWINTIEKVVDQKSSYSNSGRQRVLSFQWQRIVENFIGTIKK